MRTGAAIVLCLTTCSCAAVFRGPKATITVESSPGGAEAKVKNRKVGLTPTRTEIDRAGLTQVTLTKEGYSEHTGTVMKRMNSAWLTVDILTCVFPVALCIPLLVDAISGSWYDVDDRYLATLRPFSGDAGPPAQASTPTPQHDGSPASALVHMSESERKATARAAYAEGIALQEKGQCAEALRRFEAAQTFFSAPTHLLHIGQCQAATGMLVEAAETYQTLTRTPLGDDAPEAFVRAQTEGQQELARLKPRIPTLRIQLSPQPSSLSSAVIKLNGNTLPIEVVGIARPVNPGKYTVTVWASGYKEATATAEVGEGTPTVVRLTLTK